MISALEEWRYLRKRPVLHRVWDSELRFCVAYCGITPHWGEGWLGTGCQEEYEMAAMLRKCRRCERSDR